MNRNRKATLIGLLGLTLFGAGTVIGGEPQAPAAPAAPQAPTAPQAPAAPHVWVSGDDGRVRVIARFGRGRLGVSIADLDEEKVKELGVADVSGALITDVSEDSAAAKAGIQKNDVVVEFDGVRVRSSAQLARLVRETPAGRKVTLRVRRGGDTKTLTAELESGGGAYEFLAGSGDGPRVRVAPMPRIKVMPRIEVMPRGPAMFFRRPRLGISGDNISGQLADYFKVSQGHGVLVAAVNEGSAAEKAGLQAGDVIVKAGDAEVESMRDLRRALGETDKEDPQITLTIIRGGKERQVQVTLDIPEDAGIKRWSGLVCSDEDCDLDFDFNFDFNFDFDPGMIEEHLEGLGDHLEESLRGLRGLHGLEERFELNKELLLERDREIRERHEQKLRTSPLRRI